MISSIKDLLVDRAGKFDTAPVFLSEDRPDLSYRDLWHLVSFNAEVLSQKGIKSDSRVGVLLEKGELYPLCLLSLLPVCVIVPVNPVYTYDELLKVLPNLNLDYILIEKETDLRLEQLAKKLNLPLIQLSFLNPNSGWQITWEFERVSKTKSGFHNKMSSDENLALILHTSGSTSAPKVVALTHNQLLVSAENMANSLGLGPSDCCLSMMPMFHIGAIVDLLLAPIFSGGSIVFSKQISSESFWNFFKTYRITWYQGVPTMLQDIVNHDKRVGGQNRPEKCPLRFIRSVSSALSASLKRDLEAIFNVPVVEIYGMTETAGVIASNTLSIEEHRLGSVGKSAGPEIKIIDAEGNSAAPGMEGEIIVRGESVITSYETGDANEFIDKWLRTGDRGYLDKDGFLFLTGRVKEMINRGGEKIAPREIDELAMEHDDVTDAAAFAVEHSTLGEEVALAVVLRQGSHLDESAMIESFDGKIAPFKIPRKIYFLDALPRNPGGKLKRFAIPELVGLQKPVQSGNISEQTLPQKSIEKQVWNLWKTILNVEEIYLESNFFDLGGDSLSAANFLSELKKQYPERDNFPIIYDCPVLSDFVGALAATALNEVQPDEIPAEIPASVLSGLRGFLSAWAGDRATESSLLVGINTLGGRTPIFWAGQQIKEVRLLSRKLGLDQPIYAMRTLFRVEGRKPEYNEALSELYCREILEIQTESPYFICGYCEGGKVAHKIARKLIDLGHEVRLLGIIDQMIPEPYYNPALIMFSEEWFTTRFAFQFPEDMVRKTYGPTRKFLTHPGSHTDFFQSPESLQPIEEFAAQIRSAQNSSDLALEWGGNQTIPQLPESSFNARLSARLPYLMGINQTVKVRVCICNTSTETWEIADHSGLALAYRWLKRDYTYHRRLGTFIGLAKEILPGESLELILPVTAPPKECAPVLEIDLVEEGVCWFHERGSKSLRKKMNIFGFGRLFSFFRTRLTS